MTRFEPFERLLEEIRDKGIARWSEIEANFVSVLSEFDTRYALGNQAQGWYQGKARYFNDVVARLIENGAGCEVAIREKRRSGLFGEIDIDLCHPKTGDPVVAAEVKALGTPPHPGNKNRPRAAKSDLHKRVREVALTSMDLKAAYTGPQAIQSFNDWVAKARPAYLSFWALRIDSNTDLSKCRSILTGLNYYCNGVGALLYAPGKSATEYDVRKHPEYDMDRAIHEFVQRIKSNTGKA